jgi:hypothetical protein
MLHGEFLPDLFVVVDAISRGWRHQLPSATDRITCSWVGSEATAKESERESEEMRLELRVLRRVAPNRERGAGEVFWYLVASDQ